MQFLVRTFGVIENYVLVHCTSEVCFRTILRPIQFLALQRSKERFHYEEHKPTHIADLETAQKFLEFVDALEDDDDVQKVYHNAEFSEDVLKALESSDD